MTLWHLLKRVFVRQPPTLRVSTRWLDEQTKRDMESGWDNNTRWRSPAEIRQMRDDDDECEYD